jgi:hypothetical protein
MNTAVTRLIWKEYRSQRAIWLAIFIGMILIFLMMQLAGEGIHVVEATIFSAIPAAAFMMISLTVAFAGELDNRTDIFLRMLPCDTRKLFLGKTLITVLGGLLLIPALCVGVLGIQLLVTAICAFLPVTVGVDLNWRPRSEGNLGEDVALFSSFAALMTASAFLSSLLTRRVFNAIFLAAGLLSAEWLLFLFESPLHRASAKFIVCWNIAFFTVFLVAAMWLAHPWHRGQVPFRLRWMQTAEAGGAGNIRIGLLRLTWLRAWLRYLAGLPFSRSRVLRTLAWKELRSIVPFVVLAVPAMVAGYVFDLASGGPPIFMFLIPLLVLFECGQRSVRDDQKAGTLRMLASMGLSPGTIWMTKTFVWFAAATIPIAVMLLIDRWYAWLIQLPADRTAILNDLTPPIVRFIGTMSMDVVSAQGLAAIVATFAVGQLTAAWIQRQIMAFAVGLLSMMLCFMFGGYVFSFGWSLWLTVVPMAFVLLSVAGWTSREWVDARSSLRIILRRAAMVIVPLILCSTLGWTWWRYEPRSAMNHLMTLPEIHRARLLPLGNGTNALGENFWKEVTSPPDNNSPWKQFSRRLSSVESVPLSTAKRDLKWAYKPFSSPASVDSIAQLLAPFEQLLTKPVEEWPPLPVDITSPGISTGLEPLAIIGVLIEDARLKSESEQFQDAGRRLILAVQLARRISEQTSSWNQWLTCLLAEQRALDHLRALANAHAAELDLRSLYDSLKTSVLVKADSEKRLFVIFPDPRPMLHNRTLLAGLLHAIRSNADYRQVVSRRYGHSEGESVSQWISSTAAGPEAGRQADLIAYSEMLMRMRINDVMIGGDMFYAVGTSPQLEHHFQSFVRLIGRSAVWDLATDVEVTGAVPAMNPAIKAMAAAIASERATLLILLLHQHRKDHGSFPATLFDLQVDPYMERLVRIDPFTGEAFFYAATGISKPILLTPTRIEPTQRLWAPEHQPLLVSAGISGLTMTWAINASKHDADTKRIAKLPEHAILFLIDSNTEDDALSDLPTVP